jgi:3-oxoacyl-[acyl-carrier-protein] synthase II
VLKRAVAITGVGVVSGRVSGDSTALQRPASSVFGAPVHAHWVSEEVLDSLLGEKGLRDMNRASRLAYAASRLALRQGSPGGPDDRWATGVVAVGSSYGNLESLTEFDAMATSDGMDLVNPKLFPNCLLNCMAARLAIHLGLRGPNITVSNGATSGLDAITMAYDLVSRGVADLALAGGTESLHARLLRAIESEIALGHRQGPVSLEEGAAFVVLEPCEAVEASGRPILGTILGHDSGFGSDPVHTAQSVLDGALEHAGMDRLGRIHWAFGSGRSGQRDAVRRWLGGNGQGPLAAVVDEGPGCSLGATGALLFARGLAQSDGGPPTAVLCLDPAGNATATVIGFGRNGKAGGHPCR